MSRVLVTGLSGTGKSVLMKHVTEPQFGTGEKAFVLERQTRAGIALLMGAKGGQTEMVLAVDDDLTTTPTAT